MITRWIVVKKKNVWVFNSRCFYSLVIFLVIIVIYYSYSSFTLSLVHLHFILKSSLQILTTHISSSHHFLFNFVIWTSKSRSANVMLCKIKLESMMIWERKDCFLNKWNYHQREMTECADDEFKRKVERMFLLNLHLKQSFVSFVMMRNSEICLSL